MVVADLTGPRGVDALASAAQKLGTVDVLVNNAGTYSPMSFDQGPNKGQGPLDGELICHIAVVHFVVAFFVTNY